MNKKNIIKHNPQPGKALILVGEGNADTLIIARKISAEHGSYAEIHHKKIGKSAEFNDALIGEPQTLIVEGFPDNKNEIIKLKEMITSDTTLIHSKNRTPKIINTPNLIFCTSNPEPLNAMANDRRFCIFNINQA